jgi:hypothetical protein
MSEERDPSEADVDVVLWLTETARPTPPPALLARIDARMARTSDRPGRFLAVVAACLSFAFVFQGVGNLVVGEWLAENLGEPYAGHPFREGGLAFIAIGVCAATAVVSRRWAGVSVLTCTPLAIGFGLHGITEIGVFAAGVALHTTEGLLGLLLAVAWWLDRRDTPSRRHEGGT